MPALKPFEYKGVTYEVRIIKRLDGSWFLKDFKDGNPFSPFYYGAPPDMDFVEFDKRFSGRMIDYLYEQAKYGIQLWVDNKDKIGV